MSPGRFGTKTTAHAGLRSAGVTWQSARNADQEAIYCRASNIMSLEKNPHVARQHCSFSPIDHRWQPSQGIRFSEGNAPALSNFTWVPGSSIRFADARHASTKASPLPRSSYQSSTNPKTSPTLRSDASHKNTAFNFASVGGSVAELKLNQQRLRTENNRLMNLVEEAQQEVENLELRLKTQAETLHREMLSEVARWKKDNERLKDIDDELQIKLEEQQRDWNNQLQTEREIIKASFQSAVAAKAKTVSSLQTRLLELEKERSDAYNKSQSAAKSLVAEQEASREAEHHQTLAKLRSLQTESERACTDAQRAKRDIDRRLSLERDRFNQQLYRRNVERSDYNQYNAHFAQLHNSLGDIA